MNQPDGLEIVETYLSRVEGYLWSTWPDGREEEQSS
jgi:hypothetical protein